MLFRSLLVVSLLNFACRGDSEGEGEAEAEAEGEGEAASIYAVQLGELEDGAQVTLRNVVVTAVDARDSSNGIGNVYVQEIEEHETHGRRYSGVLVFRPDREDFENGSVTDLLPGDLVTVRGEVDEFALSSDDSGDTMTEISNATVERLGAGEPLEPVDVSVAELTYADSQAEEDPAEPWEGVLIRVSNVRAVCGPSAEGGTYEVLGEGNQAVDISTEFFAGTAQFDDCFDSLVGPLNYFFSYRIEPRDASDFVTGSDCPELTMTPISDIQSGALAKDTQVRVRGILTAVDTNEDRGIFVQEGTGPNSGIFVYGSPRDAEVGDEIVVSGGYEEFYDVSEIGFASVCRVGEGVMPEPEILDLTAGSFEQWEGVLVQANDVTVTNNVKDACDSSNCMNFEVDGALRVDNELFDYGAQPAMGSSFSSITGPLHYSWETYKILPRNQEDLVE